MEDQVDKEPELNQNKSSFEKCIENEQEWDSFYEKVQQESYYANLDLKKHYDAWWKLIASAKCKQNESEIIFDCAKKMIDSMPVGTLNENEDWSCYISSIYYLERKEKLSPESAEIVLKLAEKKLAITYTKVSFYWLTIRKLERNRQLPKEEYIKKCLDTYKKQFSVPYAYMRHDYKEFLHFAEDNEVDNNEIMVVKSIYDENAAEAKRITAEFMNVFNEEYHHVKFEEWICNLVEQSPPLLEKAIALCEEAVMDEKYSICYHFVLAKTLVRSGISDPSQQEKLFKALKRGIHVGRYGCENVAFYFLDFALHAASSYFSSSECCELIDDIINQFVFEESVSNFFASRKAIIYGLKTLVDKEKLAVNDLQTKMIEALKPVMQEELNETSLRIGKQCFPDFELRCIELKKLRLLIEKEVTEITWKETLDKWEEVISNTTVPEVLMEYTTFIREHGSPSDAEAAYLKSIKYMSELNNDPLTSTYGTRRCIFLLMNKLRELLAINGGKTDIVQLISEISKNQSLSSLNNSEMYYLDCHPRIIKEQLAQKLFTHATCNEEDAMRKDGSSQHSDRDSSKDVKPIIDVMEKLKVENKKDSSGYTVFLSNLDYKATRKDIVEAFKKHGLNVVGIKMKATPKNTNYGFAAVDFSSMEQATQALNDFDRIEILGRETFISVYKEKVKYSAAPFKPEPTVLFLSGLPQEWRDPKRIENALLPFGHIKSVEVSDREGTAKVQYHMPGDTTIGSIKVAEIMSGTGVNVRTGYPGQKSPVKKQVKVKPIRQENGAKEPFVKKFTPSSVPVQPPEVKSVKKEFRPNILVPRQLRQQMKKKLDVTDPDSKAGSSDTPMAQMSDETEELGPSKEKRIKVESTSQGQKLTNNDFRKMLKK